MASDFQKVQPENFVAGTSFSTEPRDPKHLKVGSKRVMTPEEKRQHFNDPEVLKFWLED